MTSGTLAAPSQLSNTPFDPNWDENFQEIDPRKFFNKPENKEKLQATLVENAMREPSLNVISWIAKEMKDSLGNDEWNNFRIL